MDLQELANHFRQFGVHKPHCRKEHVTAKSCPCGFVDVLVKLPVNTNAPCGTPSIDNPEEPRPPYTVPVGLPGK